METRALGERIAAVKREIRARSQDGVERRWHPTTLEARDSAAGWQISGYGIVYNSLSENLGGFREQVAPGAARGLLDNPDIWGLFNHNADLPLGRTGARTMALEDDAEHGVRYVIDPPDTSYANDLRVSIERGDVTRSSFAFRIARQGETWDDDPETGLLLRTITRFSALYDFSPVTYAAYLGTSTGVESSAARAADTAHDDERLGDDPSAGERAEDGADVDTQAEHEGYRLALRKRRLRLRDCAE